jgi:hypothetical protein
MKAFAIIALSWFACMAAAALGCVAIFGWPDAHLPVEVLTLPRTSFRDEALRAIFETRTLAKSGRPLLLILGASAAQEGYRPAVLQPLLPGYSVNNLSMGGANVTEMDQVLELALKSARPAALRGSELVLGLSFPVFVRDARRWTHPDFVRAEMIERGELVSDIVKEATRCPPLLDPCNPVFRLTPAPVSESLRGYLAILLPLLPRITAHPADRLLASWRWRFKLPARVNTAAPAAVPAREFDERRQMQQQMNWLNDYMGEKGNRMPEEQFAVLQRIIAKARAVGMRVTAVSLPLPTWHKSGSPYHGAYEEALQEAMCEWAGDPGVRLVDLSSSASDASFRDSCHPRPEAAAAWSAALAEAIKER